MFIVQFSFIISLFSTVLDSLLLVPRLSTCWPSSSTAGRGCGAFQHWCPVGLACLDEEQAEKEEEKERERDDEGVFKLFPQVSFERKGKEERGERKKICKRRSKLCVRKQQKDEWRKEKGSRSTSGQNGH